MPTPKIIEEVPKVEKENTESKEWSVGVVE
jgi:hypothetical protein